MIVTMQARYSALHYEDAVAQATAIWRDFIGDPDADLPWDSSIRIELGTEEETTVDGAVISRTPTGDAVLNAKISKTAE